jgi:threonine/homoserine/homoserine lactone efflux protein
VEETRLAVFVLATVALTVAPGPAVLYIVTRSTSQGGGAGVVSCLGVALGAVVHVLNPTPRGPCSPGVATALAGDRSRP